MTFRIGILCLVCLLPDAVVAQTPSAATPAASAATPALAASAPKVFRLGKVSLRPGGAAYPAALAEQGIQGTTDVLVTVGADGVPTELSVQSSSRSDALDQAAIAVAKDLKYELTDRTRAPLAVVVPVEFLRDSVATLGKKTCAEFNVDVAYSKATFPEREVRKMDAVNMTAGLFAAIAFQGSSAGQGLASIRKVEAAAAGIVEACARAPEASYLKTFAALVKSAGTAAP